MNSQLVWAAKEPWSFLYYTLLLLSPCFLVSAHLSWRLSRSLIVEMAVAQQTYWDIGMLHNVVFVTRVAFGYWPLEVASSFALFGCSGRERHA